MVGRNTHSGRRRVRHFDLDRECFGSNLNDLLIGDNHNNTFSPSRGDDTIHGGGGTDELRYDRGPGEPTPDQGIKVTFTDEGMGTVTANDGTTNPSTDPRPDFGLNTFTGIESIRETREADMFIGAAGSQRFRGLAGDDYFDGGESLEDEDEVDFSRDAVAPTGTAGVTVDLVLGTASGFDGSDTLLNIEHIRGTNNDDSVTGDGADNRFRGEGGNDTLIGAGGNDRLQGGAGNDTLDGGAGDEDEADYWQDILIAGGAGVDVDLDHANSSDDNGIAFGPNGDTDTLIGIENAWGTINNDNFIGDAQANRFRGEAGNDTMQGGGGQDQLEGGAGDDWLYGGDDNDLLDGGSGRDRFIGLEGNDTFVGGGGVDLDVADYSFDAGFGATQGIVVNMWGSGSQGGLAADTAIDSFGDTDSIANVRDLVGTQFRDLIYGGGHDNHLTAGAGDDYVFGHDGIDTILGEAGNDVLDGGKGNDIMTGGAGKDSYYVNTGDVVNEAAGAGTDTVLARSTFVLAASAVGVESLRAASSSVISSCKLPPAS